MKLSIRKGYSPVYKRMRFYLYTDDVYVMGYDTEPEAQAAFENERKQRVKAGTETTIREEEI